MNGGLLRRPRTQAVLLALVLCAVAASSSTRGQAVQSGSVQVVDSFETIAPWQAAASEGVRALLGPAEGPKGRALRLDFDLDATAGYAAARRALSFDLPANYEISFDLRADAQLNEFQFKLLDASGENVWWFRRRDFDFPTGWRHMRIKKRQIEFAWGPSSDHTLRRAAGIEFVVAAGRDGGAGTLFIANLELRALPIETGIAPALSARASSSLADAGPDKALDGDPMTAWRSDPRTGKAQSFTIDLGRTREFGGLIVQWLPGGYASHYDVLLSRDGERWHTVKDVTDGTGGPDFLALPESEARFVRLLLADGPGPGYALAEVAVEDLAFGANPNSFVTALARDAPRGTYPRGFSGEQPYWTVVGIDGGSESALISEDGALEVRPGGFSVEPFVVAAAGVTTWADVEQRQSLVDGYLPMPIVVWRARQWELTVHAFADGTPEHSSLMARYELVNRTGDNLELTLALAVRPFQVNPPSQFLNTSGGVSPIHDLTWDGAALLVDGRSSLNPLPAPGRVGTFSFGAGPIPRLLGHAWPDAHSVHDFDGFASAVLAYRLTLAPQARTTVRLVVPLSGPVAMPAADESSRSAWFDAREAAVASAWREQLNRVRFRVPPAGQQLVDTLRTALGHLLITRDGPILRPGTRSYSRSWIRDGTMISEALLRLGDAGVPAAYLRWYAPFQFANGKIPCCVDARGADPVAENDSPGEFIFLVEQVYRYTGDAELLKTMWPHVAAAADYLEKLRESELTTANRAPATRAFYGLVPASISHEGYAAKPVHSYWDDFWALKGYDAACWIAQALGRMDDAERLAFERDQFRKDLAASLEAAMAAHAIDYLPGSAELGDFDPTSTSIAFAPLGDTELMRPEWVQATFERYWRDFLDRRDGRSAWSDYTPYELRNVATFVRLGWRDRVSALLGFFLEGRRPPGWNQWAEVVGRDPRTPRFVGDMPHAWVESDFIRAVLDMFLYERVGDRSLVLGAGIPVAWFKDGVGIEHLRTPYGAFSYAMGEQDGRVVVDVSSDDGIPPGGIVFPWPYSEPPRTTTINGRAALWHNDEVVIRELPARVVVER